MTSKQELIEIAALLGKQTETSALVISEALLRLSVIGPKLSTLYLFVRHGVDWTPAAQRRATARIKKLESSCEFLAESLGVRVSLDPDSRKGPIGIYLPGGQSNNPDGKTWRL